MTGVQTCALPIYTQKLESNKLMIERSEIKMMTKEEFEILISKSVAKFKAGNAFQKDNIARTLFLKLYIGDTKMASVIWKEPFASMIEATDVSNGRGDRT